MDFNKNIAMYHGTDSDNDRIDDIIEDSIDINWYEAENHVETIDNVGESNLL